MCYMEIYTRIYNNFIATQNAKRVKEKLNNNKIPIVANCMINWWIYLWHVNMKRTQTHTSFAHWDFWYFLWSPTHNIYKMNQWEIIACWTYQVGRSLSVSFWCGDNENTQCIEHHNEFVVIFTKFSTILLRFRLFLVPYISFGY